MGGRTAADVKYPAAFLDVWRVSRQLRGGNSRRDRYGPEYNDPDNSAGCSNDRELSQLEQLASPGQPDWQNVVIGLLIGGSSHVAYGHNLSDDGQSRHLAAFFIAAMRPWSSWLRLARRPRGGIGQQFLYRRHPPAASSEYSPRSAQCSGEADHVLRWQPFGLRANRGHLIRLDD